MSTPLFPSDDVYRRVRRVLERVPAYRPRATLQAYNAFLQRWLVVRLQGSEKIFFPELLALLLLIQYIWPDIFHRISANPYYFFYIHALATGRANLHCTQSEMAEIKDLGLPINIREKNIYPYDDPNLFRLLDIWDFDFIDPTEVSEVLSVLWSHITLDPSLRSQPVFPEIREAVWATLISGDPARIKLLQYSLSETVSRDYEQPLLESVLDLNKEFDRAGDKSNQLIADAEVRVFALGLIGSREETPKVLKEILTSTPGLHTSLKLRIVYAIERLMQKVDGAKRHEMISSLVQDVLINGRSSKEPEQRVRVRIAKLAHYGIFLSSDLKKIIKLLFKESNENVLVKLALIESWEKASWRDEALMLLTPKVIAKMIPADILKICESGSWPEALGNYFIQLAQQSNEEHSSRSFSIIRNFPNRADGTQGPTDKLNIIKWLSDLIQTSERFRKESWGDIAMLQNDQLVSWSTQTWASLKSFAINNDDLSIIHALKDIKRSEARNLLQSMLHESPVHWQNVIKDALADE